MSKLKSPRALALLGLVTLTIVAYAPVLGAGFINFDDPGYVTKSPKVPDGLTWDGFVWAWTATHLANWHPLTWIVYMLDVSIFGMNPTGHHLVNLVLHVVNVVLVARFMYDATKERGKSLAVAMLFALHPLHVESVAWISELKDVLSMFFWLLTLIAWTRWAVLTSSPAKADAKSDPKLATRSYVAAMIFFVLASLTKPSVVTLPFVLLLFDVWPLGRLEVLGIGVKTDHDRIGLRKAIVEKLPFFFISIGSSIATYVVQRGGGAMMKEEAHLRYSIGNVVVSYMRYVGKTFWPMELAIIYPFPKDGWPIGIIAGSAVALLVLTAVAFRMGRRRPWVLIGWLFFAGVLVPMVGIVQVGTQSIADRYTYTSILGLFIILVWGLDELLGDKPRGPALLAGLGVTVALVSAALTYRQAGYWKDGETLFRHAAAVTIPNAVAYEQLGDALSEQQRYEEAEAAYRASVAAAPGRPAGHTFLGALLTKRGKLDEARREHERALALDPMSVQANYNLGLMLLGNHEVDKAMILFDRAVKSEPKSPMAHAGRGLGLMELKRYDEAIAELKLAIKLDPHGALPARDGLGLAYAHLGHLEEARVVLMETVKMDPSRAVAHANLGDVLAQSGRIDEAIREFETAVRLNPEDAHAQSALGRGLLMRGDIPNAIVHYEAALRLDPKNPVIGRELAMARENAPAPPSPSPSPPRAKEP